jgi:hypothetical protein
MEEDDPTKRNGANNHERAESKAAANLAIDYPSREFAATGNHWWPGTATAPLTQGRFAFDSGPPFSDSHIERYLRVLARDLTDDGVRDFLRARFAYSTFQRLGTPQSRCFAWHAIWLAIQQSAKTPGPNLPGPFNKDAYNRS